MKKILDARQAIYDQFDSSRAASSFFFRPENRDIYAAYYTSMYLIQDTGEALFCHALQGFSSEPMQAYLEFWGVMQAIFIQQDAIKEMYKAVDGSPLKIESQSAWVQLREFRNLCAGHPAKRDRDSRNQPMPAQRTFMGRNFGNYDAIKYEFWDAGTGNSSHPTVNLRDLLEKYDAQAAEILGDLLVVMNRKWPPDEEMTQL
jgi:hypothetical protein